MTIELDKLTVATEYGPYTIAVIADELAGNPLEDCPPASSIAIDGRRSHVDAVYGDLAAEVLAAIRRGYSEAAIVRALIRGGATGVHLVRRSYHDGSLEVIDARHADTAHGHQCGDDWMARDMSVMSPKAHGVAFLGPGVAEREQVTGRPDALVRGEIETYAAWAGGDVVVFTVTDESGAECGSHGPYYGWLRWREDMLSEARAVVEENVTLCDAREAQRRRDRTAARQWRRAGWGAEPLSVLEHPAMG